MPDYRFSSLPSSHRFLQSPYKDWTQLASTQQEWEKLLILFRGMPSGWLEWVDEQAERVASRGVVIREPLNYRLSVLWNGMILLQEAKFICDWMEHALRQAFLSYLQQSELAMITLKPTVPTDPTLDVLWEQLEYCERMSVIVDSTLNINRLTDSLVNAFTFYVLTETMVRNWKRIKGIEPPSKGFQQIFWTENYCRSADNFTGDMKKVRTMRNIIAHSKRLLEKHEVSEIFEVVCRWLKPLDVDLNTRIIDYRHHRPRFLNELGIT